MVKGKSAYTVAFVSVVQHNNHNAGELLILALFEGHFGNNRSGDCGYIRQPVIA